MSDWVLVLQFLLVHLVKIWNIVMSVWWLALPIFATVIFNIVRLIFSIQPSDDNRDK